MYNIPLDPTLERILGNHKSVKLTNLINEKNQHLAEPGAINLLEKMMIYDHVLVHILGSKPDQQQKNACSTPTLMKFVNHDFCVSVSLDNKASIKYISNQIIYL